MNYDQEMQLIEGYADKMIASDIPGAQRGIVWLMERVGHCTASRFKDVEDILKSGKPGAKRISYLWEVVIERLTGKPTEHYVSAPMEWGTATEPLARMAYEARTGNMVVETGFTHHKAVKWCGGSVDGLVDDAGIIEIKCPSSATHIKQLLTNECEHLAQIQGGLWITGRQWCDYISFDPRLPERLQLYVVRINRDDDYIAELAGNVLKFLAEVDELVTRLNQIGAAQESPPVNPSPVPAPSPSLADQA